MAVARDSGGAWFRSDRHFCGAFMNYRRERELRDELRSLAEREGTSSLEEVPPSPTAKQLDPIFGARDLEHARRLLKKMGFEAFRP